jgi:hypothetical protein
MVYGALHDSHSTLTGMFLTLAAMNGDGSVTRRF